MSSLSLTRDEREAFLAGVHVAVIGVDRAGRAPLTIPIWYDYSPGGEVLIWTDAASTKADLIKAAGRLSLCVQQEERPVRYVSVEGPVVGWEEPVPLEIATAIARRYMGETDGDNYVSQALPTPSVLIRIRPERWSTMDESKLPV
jgi:hypothetical protein